MRLKSDFHPKRRDLRSDLNPWVMDANTMMLIAWSVLDLAIVPMMTPRFDVDRGRLVDDMTLIMRTGIIVMMHLGHLVRTIIVRIVVMNPCWDD